MHNHDGWICTFASSKDAFFDAKDQDKRFPIEERFNEEKNDCLQNNDCIYLILKDLINDGLVATPKQVLSKSHGQVSSVEMYFNDFLV